MKSTISLRHFLTIASSSLLAVSSSFAQTTVNWEGDTDTLWATAGNWDTAPTNSLTVNIANFNLATYDGVTVFAPSVGTATSIAGITIGASNGTMTLTNTPALSIGASGISIANGAGAFTISGSTTLGASQSWTNNSGNLFTFGAVSNGSNLLTIGGSGNITASGIIGGGAGGLTKEGSGILTLGAANTYSGATTVNGGELRWGVANAINAGALNVNDGGTVNIQSFNDSVGTITIAKGGNITGTSGILTTTSLVSNDGGSISFSGGRIVLNNLTYNDTISGSTTLSIDRLELKAGTFNIARGDDASGVDLDITTVIFGDGNGRNLIKSGSGVMRLSGATASTAMGNGTLSIQDGTVIFNKSAEVAAFGGGGLFTIGDGNGDANSAVLRYESNSNQLVNNFITINSDGLFNLNGFSETTTGSLTMNGGSITTGAGTLFLGASTNSISGASTVTGNLTFNRSSGNANILVLGGTASIDGTTTFTGDNNTGITATGNTSIAGTLVLGTQNRAIAVTNASDVLTISATTSGTGTITKTGAGTLITTAASALPQHATLGRVVINGGTLGVRVGGSGWTTGEVDTLLTNATKTSGALGIDTTNGNLTQWTAFTTTNLGSTLGLAKLGTNTLTLDQANTYTGTTTVTAGTLLVNNTTGSGTGTGAVNVADGATLGGSGTISGATTIAGNLNPGNSPGLLSFGNSLTLETTAVTTMEITGLTRSTEYDAVNVTGQLTYAGDLIIQFATTLASGATFNLFDFGSQTGSFDTVTLAGSYTGTLTNSGGVWSLTSGGNSWTFTQSTGDLTFAVIPEPKAALLGMIGVLLLLRRRR